MEKILVPTDLADKSELSLMYAIDLGEADKAQIILFNDAIKEDGLEEADSGLKQAISNIQSSHSNASAVKIEPQSDKGAVLEGISKKLREEKYSLISMVTHAQENIDFNIGSISTKIAQKGKAPSLLIPENNEYARVKNVLVVNDFTDARTDEPAFKHLEKVLKNLKATAFLLQATQEGGKLKPSDNPEAVMGGVKPAQTEKATFDTYQDFINKVEEYVRKMDIQMIYLPSSQLLFEKLFVGNLSRQLALATKVPVYIYF